MKNGDEKNNRANNNYELMVRLYNTNQLFIERINNIRREIENIDETSIQNINFNPINQCKDFQVIINRKINNKIDSFIKSEISKIINDFKLPKNFNLSLAYLIIYKILLTPAYNFDINITNLKSGDYNTSPYTNLTQKERKLRYSKEKKLSQLIQCDKIEIIKKHSENYNRNISVNKEMGKRGIKKEEKINSFYLEQLSRKEPKKFNEIKKLPEHKSKISIEKTRYTSKGVAEKILGSPDKSANVRQIDSRINKFSNKYLNNKI